MVDLRSPRKTVWNFVHIFQFQDNPYFEHTDKEKFKKDFIYEFEMFPLNKKQKARIAAWIEKHADVLYNYCIRRAKRWAARQRRLNCGCK